MWKDSETELDFLDFDYLIGMLKDIIEDETLLPSSVGVYGDWGSGKSSLIRMSIKEFQEKEDDTVCIIFNGWLFEGYEDAKTALMGTILDTIQSKRTLTAKAKNCITGLYKSVDKFKLLKNSAKYGIDFLATGGIGTVTELTLKNLFGKLGEAGKDIDQETALQAIQDELSNKEIRENIKEFQQNFSDLLAETNINRLVVFIDELDRCNPDTILETLEAIRLFLFTGNSVFIIGADERHISYAVKRKFEEIEGQQINIGKEYLEKIIQYPIRIPRLNKEEVEFYITCLLFEKDLTPEEFNEIIEFLKREKLKSFLDFSITYSLISSELPAIADKVKESISIAKQLSAVLSNGLNGNPRHCKRFLNSLVMREKMANYKNIQLDRKVLAKIMLLEYFKTPLFRKIAALSSEGNGKSEELKQLESLEIDDKNELKVWNEDKWVREWCEIDPKLNEIDLRPYFYFARESLSEKVSFSTEKLSPNAMQIIEKLLSKSRASKNEAIQKSIEVNDYEAINILQTVFNSIISDTQIDKDLLKSYLEWGQTREILFANVLSDLSSIHGEKITLPMLPIIKGFMTVTNKGKEIIELTSKWSEENTKLATAIEKIFTTKGE
ncbi:KAP family P-loop NTPase fold protein [Metabacillus halosaccharovorans]|uniref:KAP family P-loop NTPase fold protein n=1 Tax=Metabacillus halosaccharovorans TaxID=930124 RepID=UPI001C1FC2D3|nr:P-loop NTPase fold protein [Metabacillus halosaccharovorans]MBU7595879.1 NTPase [Metabacillus halosaccharovorans]